MEYRHVRHSHVSVLHNEDGFTEIVCQVPKFQQCLTSLHFWQRLVAGKSSSSSIKQVTKERLRKLPFASFRRHSNQIKESACSQILSILQSLSISSVNSIAGTSGSTIARNYYGSSSVAPCDRNNTMGHVDETGRTSCDQRVAVGD